MARPRKFDDETRAALIRDTAEQIVSGGIESVSLRPLAAKHGCSTTAIYTMFGSRDALIGAVVQESINSFVKSQESVPVTGSALADLLELGRGYRRWALAYPTLYVVMLGYGGRDLDVSGETLGRGASVMVGTSPAFKSLVDRVCDAIRSGDLGEYPVEEIVTSMWVGVHGWVSIETTRAVTADQDGDEAFERHMRSLVRAWAR